MTPDVASKLVTSEVFQIGAVLAKQTNLFSFSALHYVLFENCVNDIYILKIVFKGMSKILIKLAFHFKQKQEKK